MPSRNLRNDSDKGCELGKIMATLILLGLIIVLLDGCCSFDEQTRTKTDTVMVDIYQDTFRIQTEPELIYLRDTIIRTQPFSFSIDTVIESSSNYRNIKKYDTVRADYNFPENLFNLTYHPQPDTVFKEREQKVITKHERLTLWDQLPIIISTAIIFLVIGFLIGKISR